MKNLKLILLAIILVCPLLNITNLSTVYGTPVTTYSGIRLWRPIEN